MKRVSLAAAALVAAAVVSIARILPPRRMALPAQPSDGTVAGALHVHTDRSDGRGSSDEVARQAALAGLAFVIFTDHGDGTRSPDPPTYRSGVLCLDGVEISTNGGHYIALGLPEAPYPLGGDARDVVEDVRRLGGFGIVAHPDSPNPELRWTAWDAPFDAVEIVNLDTAWRVAFRDSRWRLLSRFLTYPFRPEETLASLIAPAQELLERYDDLTATRPVVAVAGVDAHGQISVGRSDPGDSGRGLPIPSYEASFRALALHVRPERPLTGDASADGGVLLSAIRDGRLYVAVDGLAAPPSLEIVTQATDERGGAAALQTIRIRSNRPDGFATALIRGGQPLDERADSEFALTAPAEGPYRVEVRASASPNARPWVLGSAFGGPPRPPPAPLDQAPVAERRALFDRSGSTGWRTETDPTSLAALDVPLMTEGRALRLRFGLSGGTAAHQYAALVVETPSGLAPFDRVTFSARAERPMRISVQARGADPEKPGADTRWQRSVYVDPEVREHSVRFADMRPVGVAPRQTLPRDAIRDLVFVIDLTNTKVGASGRLWMTSAELQR